MDNASQVNNSISQVDPLSGGNELTVFGPTRAMGSESSPSPVRGSTYVTGRVTELFQSPARGGGGDCLQVLEVKPPLSLKKLPSGHRFFPDCKREQAARWIEWAMRVSGCAWFCTLTFRDFVSVGKAVRMRDRWLARINQSYKDITGGRRLKSFCATEWQTRDVIHYHLLLLGADLDTLSRKRWECRWGGNGDRFGGGFARNYNAVIQAVPYLTKYMNKERGGELDIGGAWLGIKPPKSLVCQC